MLNLGIGILIHKDRERELERQLELRRLLERPMTDPRTTVREPRAGRRQSPAGAAS
jgi:hypothetical protein